MNRINLLGIYKMIFNSRNILVGAIALILVGLSTKQAQANHLLISNFKVEETSKSTRTITYSADLAWENSWRTVTNQDAVWVFMKYSTDAGVTWKHARMSQTGLNPVGFKAPFGFEINVTPDRMGFFLQRTDLNVGDVSADSVQFTWNYDQDGLTADQAMAANTINKVYGIEMVLIPQGSFYAGDGNSSSDYRFKRGSADNEPWYIENAGAIQTTNSATNGYYYTSTGASGESSTGSIFTIPTSFPKGYGSIYVMKYELTEGQWVSFFNTLPVAARNNRDITASNLGGKNSDAIINRNTISWDASNPKSGAVTLRPDRPVTYISWSDLLAYADWAGLRPITELEYEKIARGSDIAPVSNEFAWGTASYIQAGGTDIYPNADEDGTEQIFNGNANLNRNNLAWSSGDGRAGGIAVGQKGPLRAGIFAESSTNRETSGSGYFGVMELSGNLSEMVVNIGQPPGRQFLGTHGDGKLTELSGYEGSATNTDWPGINTVDAARGVTGSIGSGYRGGDFMSSNIRHFQVSTRVNAVKNPDSEGYLQRYDPAFGLFGGGRLGRSAP